MPCTVSDILMDASGNLLTSTQLTFQRQSLLEGVDGDLVSPVFTTGLDATDTVTTHATTAAFSIDLMPGVYLVYYQGPTGVEKVTATVPAEATATLSSIVGQATTIDSSLASQALASAVAAAASATAAAASAAEAEATAETLGDLAEIEALVTRAEGLVLPEYATVADGITGAATGTAFTVAQPGGWHFSYTDLDGTSARFNAPYAVTATARAQEAAISAQISAHAGVALTGVLLLTSTAPKWGGRAIQNVLSAMTVPTLNSTMPLYPRDEQGNTTPDLGLSAETDPLGTLRASTHTYSADSEAITFSDTSDLPGLTTAMTVRMSVRAKLASGTATLGIGSISRTAGAYTSATLTTSWQQITEDFTGYTGATAYDLGMIPPSSSGNTYDMTAHIFGVQVYMDTGLLALPDLTTEIQAWEAGHAKSAVSYPGAIAVDSDGWVTPGANVNNVVVPIGRWGRASGGLSEWTLAVWADFRKTDYSGSLVTALAFGNTPETTTTGLLLAGGLGLDTDGGGDRYGALYSQPAYSTNASRVPSLVHNQGPIHLAVRVTRTSPTAVSVTPYINGVPCHDTAATLSAIAPEILLAGGTQSARSAHQSGTQVMASPDRWRDPLFEPRAMTEAEIRALYLAEKSYIAPTQKKIAVIGSFDSLTAFTPAPFWQSAIAASLRPGCHFFLDAIGGSRYGAGVVSDYDSATRQGLRRRMLESAAQGFDEVVWLCQYGTNDLVSGVMDPGTTTWQAGRDLIDAMIAADVAAVTSSVRSRVRRVLVTIPPHGGFIGADADANDVAREAARVAYNADCVANYASRGYADVLDWDDFVPSGFASLSEAAADAYDNGENTVFQLDGIHWSATGGTDAAAAILTPYLETRLAALTA